MLDALTSVVLSHFRIVSILLSVLKINLAPFLQEEALNDNVMRNYILIEFYRYFHNHKLHNHTITQSQICSIHLLALFLVLEFIDSYN